MTYPLGINSQPSTPSLHCTEILSLTHPATCIASVYLLKQATTSSTMPQQCHKEVLGGHASCMMTHNYA
jgi:hypothetical protein